MTVRVTEAALAKAARVAAAEGVCIVIETKGATYRIEPVEKQADLPQDRRLPEPW